MKYARQSVTALLLALTGLAIAFALVPHRVLAKSGVPVAPPVGAACKVMLRTGMMAGFGKSVTFGQNVLSGTVKASSDNWLDLTITSDPSNPDLWIPRDNISAVVYVNPKR